MTISFRVARIPKGGGRYREIYIASRQDRLALRGLLPQLHEIHAQCDSTSAAYGFISGRNCALMALQHVGHRFTLSMDLENFFESVTPLHVEHVLTPALISSCFIDGRLRQGLPTSPVISNIAFCPFDRAIIVALKVLNVGAVYTRYADDLVFSYIDASVAVKIQTVVRQIVGRGGFKVNEQKTIIQSAENGRVVVAGIAVDASGLHPTRKTRRRIRAALHQSNAASVAGLVEWSKCKLPNVISQVPMRVGEATSGGR